MLTHANGIYFRHAEFWTNASARAGRGAGLAVVHANYLNGAQKKLAALRGLDTWALARGAQTVGVEFRARKWPDGCRERAPS